MSLVSRTGNVTYNKAKFFPGDQYSVRVAKATHNCAATNIGANNGVNMIPIPANSILLSATLKIDTVEDSAATIHVGYAEDGATFISAANAQVANLVTPSLVSGYYFGSAGNVVATATGACDTCIFTVHAVYVQMDAMKAVN